MSTKIFPFNKRRAMVALKDAERERLRNEERRIWLELGQEQAEALRWQSMQRKPRSARPARNQDTAAELRRLIEEYCQDLANQAEWHNTLLASREPIPDPRKPNARFMRWVDFVVMARQYGWVMDLPINIEAKRRRATMLLVSYLKDLDPPLSTLLRDAEIPDEIQDWTKRLALFEKCCRRELRIIARDIIRTSTGEERREFAEELLRQRDILREIRRAKNMENTP
jgi:hypothetical protein